VTGNAAPDDLNFRRVVHIFLRTWPFIRPALRHLVIFVAVSAAIALPALRRIADRCGVAPVPKSRSTAA